MSKIWIPKEAGHNFMAARKYGKLVFLFGDGFSPFKMEKALGIARDKFASEPPVEEDYLLFSGHTALNMVVVVALAEHIPVINCLLFHARDQVYIPRKLPLTVYTGGAIK